MPQHTELPTIAEFTAAARQIKRSDAIIGVALLTLLGVSLIDAWFLPAWPDRESSPEGTMWNGLGYLAGFVLIAAIGYWVASTLFPERWRLKTTPGTGSRAWMLLGMMELVLVVLYFTTRVSFLWGHPAQRAYRLTVAPSVSPGWAWYFALMASGFIVLGGFLKRSESAPAPPAHGGGEPPARRPHRRGPTAAHDPSGKP